MLRMREQIAPRDQSPFDALKAAQGVLTAVPLGVVFWMAVVYVLFTG